MKIRALSFVLVAAMVSLGGMCSKPKKSSENYIETFTVGEVQYTNINHSTGIISHIYSKTGAEADLGIGAWPGLPTGWPNLTARVTLKDPKGSKITPDPSHPQNYENGTAKFTVTAEDGTSKEYKVLVIRKEEL